MRTYQYFIIVLSLCLLAVFCETTIVNFPFVFIIGSALTVWIKKIPVYVGVFMFGIIIDSLRVTDFGLTPLFIFGTVLCIFLYARYLGSDDILISSFIIAIGTLIYSYFLSYAVLPVVVVFGFISLLWYTYNKLSSKSNFSV